MSSVDSLLLSHQEIPYGTYTEYVYVYVRNAHIRNLEKWFWRIYVQVSNGETDIENRFMEMWRGEKRVRCMERVTWKLTLSYVKQDSQWEFAVWLRKLKQGLFINLDGWDGEEGSKGTGYMYTCGWFMLRFGRKQQNSVKQLSFSKNKFLMLLNCGVGEDSWESLGLQGDPTSPS